MKKILFTIAASLMLIGSAIAQGNGEISGAKNKDIEAHRNKKNSYPAVFWSQTGTQVFEETSSQVEHGDLFSKVKGLVYNSERQVIAPRVFIIRKEGMTTKEIFRIAGHFEYDRGMLLNHSVAFTNVSEFGFDSKADQILSKAFGVNATQYTLDQEDEISVLAEALAKKSDDKLKIDIINVKESLPTALLNKISQQIQDGVKASGVSNYVMGFVGKHSSNNNNGSTPFVSLQQTKTTVLPSVTTTVKAGSPSNIKEYLYPNTLSGILIMLFIVMVMLIGFLQLMAVQTPQYYSTQKMDFGKIEK